MLPFILQRIGFDPARTPTPFVATLVDVTGLVIYWRQSSCVPSAEHFSKRPCQLNVNQNHKY
jgi:hypothetical protein